MKKLLLSLCAFSALHFSISAQEGPRMFMDVPAIFVAAPDFENLKTNVGLGGAFAFNVGTHWSVARVGVGVQATADPKENLEETLATTPFALFEVGGGMYRSNGDRCAKTKRAAFTVLGKGGLRYYFDTRDEVAGLDDTGYGLAGLHAVPQSAGDETVLSRRFIRFSSHQNPSSTRRACVPSNIQSTGYPYAAATCVPYTGAIVLAME